MEMDKTSKLKQEIEEYLTKDYCCEFKKECKDGVRIRCSEYEAKLYLILRFAEPREKRIEDLEEENAELKGLVNQYKASKCGSISLVNRNMIMFDQLTKAKEILQEFVDWATWQGNSKCPSFKSIQDKAEQFLKEIK